MKFKTFLENVYHPSYRRHPDHARLDVHSSDWAITALELTNIDQMRTSYDEVRGTFDCSDNNLTTLENGPTKVMKDYTCSRNNLSNLHGAPATCHGWFDCSQNKLTSLDGVPREANIIDFSHNKLTSLHNIHKQIRRLNGVIFFSDNPITKQILGLLLIPGLTGISIALMAPHLKLACKIVNKYLPNERGMAAVDECQNELIEAGFEDYAEL